MRRHEGLFTILFLVSVATVRSQTDNNSTITPSNETEHGNGQVMNAIDSGMGSLQLNSNQTTTEENITSSDTSTGSSQLLNSIMDQTVQSNTTEHDNNTNVHEDQSDGSPIQNFGEGINFQGVTNDNPDTASDSNGTQSENPEQGNNGEASDGETEEQSGEETQTNAESNTPEPSEPEDQPSDEQPNGDASSDNTGPSSDDVRLLGGSDPESCPSVEESIAGNCLGTTTAHCIRRSTSCQHKVKCTATTDTNICQMVCEVMKYFYDSVEGENADATFSTVRIAARTSGQILLKKILYKATRNEILTVFSSENTHYLNPTQIISLYTRPGGCVEE